LVLGSVAAVRLDRACAPNRGDEADIARFGKLYTMNARPVQKRDRRFILSASPR
jgi:carbonic anhydrase